MGARLVIWVARAVDETKGTGMPFRANTIQKVSSDPCQSSDYNVGRRPKDEKTDSCRSTWPNGRRRAPSLKPSERNRRLSDRSEPFEGCKCNPLANFAHCWPHHPCFLGTPVFLGISFLCSFLTREATNRCRYRLGLMLTGAADYLYYSKDLSTLDHEEIVSAQANLP
jgi:hypothetical protein